MYQQEYPTTWIYMQMWILQICFFILPFGNSITLVKVLARKDPNYLAVLKMIKMDRKDISKILFFVSTVLKSVMQQWLLYGLHFIKSLRKRALKMASKKKSSKKNKPNSNKSKDNSNKGNKDNKPKENAGNDNKDNKDTTVQTEKKEE